MAKATFRFYEELNDFLPRHRWKKDFTVEFNGRRSIRDMVEALGVPSTEVDLVLANGKPVDFDYIIQDDDRFSVYPVFESLNIEGLTRLKDAPLRKTRFIVDPSLGYVVKKLRLLSFDVHYNPSLSVREMIEISNRENRIILTSDKKFFEYKTVTRVVYVRQGAIEEQMNKILERFDIMNKKTGP